MLGRLRRRRAAESVAGDIDLASVRSHGSEWPAAPVELADDAASSVNIDEAGANEDSAELVRAARATVERLAGAGEPSEYDDYEGRIAREILEMEPRRLRFGEDTASNAATVLKSGNATSNSSSHEIAFGAGLRQDGLGGYSDGFFNETKEADSDRSSVVTLNIDSYTEPQGTKSQGLRRGISSSDFKWLCIAGGVPLVFFTGTSDAIAVSGPLGTLLGYALVVPGILCITACIAEMTAFYPMEGGFALLISEYAEAPLGLAVGVTYWLSCALSVPSDILKSLLLLSVFPPLSNTEYYLSNGKGGDFSDVVFLTFFLLLVLMFALCSTRLQSHVMRFASMLTIGSVAVLCLFMWILDAGGIKGVDAISLEFWHQTGPFRPEFAGTTRTVTGALSRFFQVWHAQVVAIYSYSGIELPYTTMAEIRNARRTVRHSFWWLTARAVLVYILVVVSLTLVTSYYYDSKDTCQTNPEVVQYLMGKALFCSFFGTLGYLSMCVPMYVINAFFVFCGIFNASLRLYGATRTLHGLGFSGLLWRRLANLTRDKVPVTAALISFSASLMSYLILLVSSDKLFVFFTLFATQSTVILWGSLCFAFLRYYYAIQKQEKFTRISRSNDDYPFRSWLQPYTAMFGMTWCFILLVTLILQHHYLWEEASNRDFVAAVLPIVITLVLYGGSKYWTKSKMVGLSDIPIATAKRKMDGEEWEEDRVYSDRFKERVSRWLFR